MDSGDIEMDYRTIQSQFSSGIISPLASGLVGTDFYTRGLEIAENAFYTSTGGVYKRNGTKLIDRFDDDNAEAHNPKITPLMDGEKMFIVVFGKGYIKYCQSDTTLTAVTIGTGAMYYDNIENLSACAQDGKLYIVHPDYIPQIISWDSEANTLKIETVSFTEALSPAIAEGAIKTTVMKFDSENNYPSIQCFYDGRWFLGATKNAPTTIWCSRSYDSENKEFRYTDFTLTYQVGTKDANTGALSWESVDLADLACQYKNSDTQGSSLSWLYEFQGLMLGASNGVYACTTKSITSSTDNPLNFTKESSIGAKKNLVTSLGNYLLFVSYDGKTVNALAFSQQYNSFTGGAVSGAVSHYIEPLCGSYDDIDSIKPLGIMSITSISSEVPKVFIQTYDGELLCCHFDPANSLVAWSRLTFNGYRPFAIVGLPLDPKTRLLSLAIITGHIAGKEEDETESEFDGYCVLEQLMDVPASQLWRFPMLDKNEEITATTSKVVTGTAKEGYTSVYPYNPENTYLVKTSLVGYYTRNLSRKQKAPASYDVVYPSKLYGTTIAHDDSDTTWYIGEEYDFAVCTLRAELPANGTSQGTMRAVKKVVLRLFSSAGGEVFLFPGIDAGWASVPLLKDITNDLEQNETLYPPYMRKPLNYAKQPLYRMFNKNTYSEWIKLYTGDIDIQFTTPTVDDDRIAVVQREPLPFAVCAIIVTRAVKES